MADPNGITPEPDPEPEPSVYFKDPNVWLRLQTEDEMAEMESEIRGLDADLQAKTASLKLAHTRLETRTRRPGVDLCRDQVCGAQGSASQSGGQKR